MKEIKKDTIDDCLGTVEQIMCKRFEVRYSLGLLEGYLKLLPLPEIQKEDLMVIYKQFYNSAIDKIKIATQQNKYKGE